MYRSTEAAISAYLKKYEIKKAIQRAQQERAAASTQDSFDFWNDVTNQLKNLLPKKTFKSKKENEQCN